MKKSLYTLSFLILSIVSGIAQSHLISLQGSTLVPHVVDFMAGEVIISEINYNNPGSDAYEFIELYNNGDEAVELEGWSISNEVSFTFPAFSLAPGEFVIVAGDAEDFETAFGFLPLGEFSGSLTNTSGTIEILDDGGTLVDMVTYSEDAPWPSEADGDGPSLVLCDYDSDNNDGGNWAASVTSTGFEVNGTEILANPGADSECPVGAVISLANSVFNVVEDNVIVQVTVEMTNGEPGTTTVDLVLNGSSTATNGEDYMLSLPVTISFEPNAASDVQTVAINVLDDSDIESTEVLILELTNPTNGGSILSGSDQFTLNILDNDTPLTNAMVISGVFDTQVEETGQTWAKGLELQAIENIPDISIFGIGSASNGGGSDGQEIELPAVSVSAGDCIYVASDSMLFFDFFGFFPHATGAGASVNGNDAFELFENNIVIDVFGEITHTGGMLDWDYEDGWAYRKDGTGPDGSIFNIDNWILSGTDVFDGFPTNDLATTPFPVCEYSLTPPTTAEANDDSVVVPFEMAQTIDVLGNDVLPIAVTSLTVTSGPANGTTTVNGLNDITYEPNGAYCGPDAFTYEVCDAEGCDEATVNITVECPTVYTPYTIAEVTEVDGNGAPVLVGEDVEVTGIVYGIDLQGVNAGGDPLNAIQFTLIDDTGGVGVFSGENFGYTVTEGDELTIQGTVSEFSCLTQINDLASLTVNSSGNPLVDPEITAFLGEEFESELIEVTNLELVNASQWNPGGTGFNVQVKKTFANDTLLMRIDNDNELFNMPAPTGPFNARGIGGQFSNGSCLVGYQFLPRYPADIIPLNNTEESWLAQKVSFFPNPVAEQLSIEAKDVKIEKIAVSNLVGQKLLEVKDPGNILDVSDLNPGIHLITFQVADEIWTSKFIKQ